MEQKSPDAFRTISEVAEWLGVPTHVLRFWESRFTQVKPVKRAGGRRYYRPSDMELLGGIRKLLHEDGMTIRGVQKLLREEGVKHVAGMSPPLDLAAEDTSDSNVVSLSARSRAAEADVEDAELADEGGPAPVDEAMEDHAVTPVSPEEDRPVSFGTDPDNVPEPAPTESPTLSDDTVPEEAAEPEEPPADTNVFADPLETATSVDEAPEEALAGDDEGPDTASFAADEDTGPDTDDGLEMVTSGDLPGDDDTALASDEPPLAPEAPVDAAPNPAATIEVSGEDDSDIAASLEDTMPDTEAPHISRADQTPEEHGDHDWTAPDDSPAWGADAAGEDPVFASGDSPDTANIWADAPAEPDEGGVAAPLVMPDLPDDPMDGTLPPEIDPLGPRLRKLRARGLMLPAAHLSALADRLYTLGRTHRDGGSH